MDAIFGPTVMMDKSLAAMWLTNNKDDAAKMQEAYAKALEFAERYPGSLPVGPDPAAQ